MMMMAEWIDRPDVRSFEADLFRRMCIGYRYDAAGIIVGGEALIITQIRRYS